MTARAFCQSGTAERAKATVHGTLGLLAGACALYNGCAFAWRGDRRLFWNLCFYVVVAAVESYQVGRHLDWWRER